MLCLFWLSSRVVAAQKDGRSSLRLDFATGPDSLRTAFEAGPSLRFGMTSKLDLGRRINLEFVAGRGLIFADAAFGDFCCHQVLASDGDAGDAP
jgi:hypothetical protein